MTEVMGKIFGAPKKPNLIKPQKPVETITQGQDTKEAILAQYAKVRKATLLAQGTATDPKLSNQSLGAR